MDPITRREIYLAKAAGEYDKDVPDAITREEHYLEKIAQNSGSAGVDVDTQMSSESANPVENQAIYAFVNSSVATNTANFKGTYNSLAGLESVTDATNKDYGFVITTDASGNTIYNRYKFNGTSWEFEYSLNNSSFTAAQWAAINSGITASDKAKITNSITASDYATQNTGGTVKVWTTTSDGETTLHIATE